MEAKEAVNVLGADTDVLSKGTRNAL